MIFPQGHVFPTRKDENWKYTSLKPWLEKSYVLSDAKIKSVKTSSGFAYKAIFVNGCFKADLSVLPSTIKITTEPTAVMRPQSESLVQLNAKFTSAATVIRLEEDAKLESALHIIFQTLSDTQDSMNYPQIKIELGDFSQAAILIQHESEDAEHTSFVSSWLNINVGVSAKLECVILQNQNLKSFHFEKAYFQLQKDSQVKVLEASLGGLLSRSEIEFDVKASGIAAELLGIYTLSQNQQSDHYTSIRHMVGGSETTQIYKGLLNGKSKGVFNGHVLIAADAQKANSEQLNKNLILSPDAEVNSKPELEIYADDVKATHGSTIGQIQKEEVFYLQTRGIKKEKAIQLVSEAFVLDVVQRLENQQLKKSLRVALQEKGAVT